MNQSIFLPRLSISLLVIVLLLINNISFAMQTADTHFYGRIHVRLATIKNQDTSLNNAGHRLGIRGEGELNNGWDFFYKLESELHNDDGLGKKDGADGHNLAEPSATSSTDLADIVIRHAHIGLANSYGQLTLGRQNNPLASSYTADVFEANSGSFEQTSFRFGHAAIFQTPNTGKARAYLGAILEGGGDEDENEQLDGYVIGGQFKVGELILHLGAFHADFKSLDSDQSEFSDVSAALAYRSGNLYLAANGEQSILQAADGSKTTTDKLDLAMTYSLKTVTYGIGYAVQDSEDIQSDRILFGAYLDLSSNNDFYIELGLLNKAAGDNDNLVAGYRITF